MVSRSLNMGHRGVALAAPISVPYHRYTQQPASYFIGVALREMLQAASLDKTACDGLMVSSYSLIPDTVVSLAEIFGMSLNWTEQVPLGGAAGTVGLRRAARAIEAGDAEVIACIGGDTFIPEQFAGLLGRFSNFTIDGVTPYASGGANLPFAILTRAYMEDFGVPREGFGRLCVMQRNNALRYRQALIKKPLTMNDYLSARLIAEPLCLFDCVMPCAGAEGFLVMSEERAKRLRLPYALLRASAERHNGSKDISFPMSFGWGDFKGGLYNAAGFGPDQIDIVQVYDDYPVMALLQMEELGFFELGESSNYLSAEGFKFNNRMVHVNSSGGQLSAGQAGFAGGFMGLVEALRQLTGTALGNQIESVNKALVSGFGMVNYDRGLCTAAAILERS